MSIPRIFADWEVLVVDDERDSLEIAARLLRLAGARVVTATNGEDAFNIVQSRSTQFRFILTDLSMPVMDGWELMDKLKKERTTIDIPIFALTAHGISGDRERGIAAGFHNYIVKPLDPTKFIQQLAALLTEIPKFAQLLVEQQ